MEKVCSELDESEFNSLFRLELGFFEVLRMISRRTKVYLTIPETFIFGFGFPQVSLLCTDYATGELHIKENISRPGMYVACGIFEQHARAGGPIAVHKLAATTYFKDVTTPQFSAAEAISTWSKYASGGRPQVLQRFIHSGSLRSSMVKAVWNGDSVKKQEFTNAVPLFSRSEKKLKVESSPPSRDSLRKRCLVLTRSEGVKCTDILVAHAIDSKVRYLVALLEKYYLPSAEFKVATLELDFMVDREGVRY